MKYLPLILSVLFLFSSCKKDPVCDETPAGFLNKWKASLIFNCASGESFPVDPDSEFMEFLPNNTIVRTSNSEETTYSYCVNGDQLCEESFCSRFVLDGTELRIWSGCDIITYEIL